MSAEVSGAAYVEIMNRDPVDREYRRSFQNLALNLVRRHGRVFDFGSGPGIDAKHYAGCGLRVGAYDVSADMCDYFARHCAAEVAAGTVRLNVGAYRDFLASRQLSGGHDIDLVVANFAPLNLVDDLPPLFAKFDTMLNAGGRLLVSVLNPFYRGQLASRRGWTRLPQLLWNGSYTTLLHGMIPVRRWLPGRLARQAEPFFQLAAIYIPLTTAPGEPAGRVSLARPADWPGIARTQFLFLHFERSGAHEPA